MKKTLVFADDDTFYTALRDALAAGNEVEVVTDYLRFSDLPEKLKTIFELEKHRSGTWVNVATGAFIPNVVGIAAGLNVKTVVVLGSAAAGAAVGLFGGPIGAAVGAGIGPAAGTVAAVMMEGHHDVTIEAGLDGKLKIHVRHAKAT